MKTRNYTHSIQIDINRCIGCSHCMRVCSTQAIRIIDGHARIQPERCIDCGECFRVCPQRAIYVKDDGINSILEDGYNIALIPSVFFGHFTQGFSVKQVWDTLKMLGFDEVFEVEQAVDFIKNEFTVYEKKDAPRPVISSFCPAVVRLIQVLYPSLTRNIMLLKAPQEIAAIYLRFFKTRGDLADKKIYIYYISPCASKIVASHSPVGEEKSAIDFSINMTDVFNLVSKKLVGEKCSDVNESFACMSPDSVTWSLSGTEKKHFAGRSLAIDGMENVIEFLEKLESGHISNIDFLEMRACDQGCAGGILCAENRFLTVERLEKRQKHLVSLVSENSGKISNSLMDNSDELHNHSGVEPVFAREGLLLDENMEKALIKMQRINRLTTYFPGFDCGACGAPGCRNLAEDIVKGNATISHCVFVQRIMEKNYKLSPEQSFVLIEKIWGKGRLNKL